MFLHVYIMLISLYRRLRLVSKRLPTIRTYALAYLHYRHYDMASTAVRLDRCFVKLVTGCLQVESSRTPIKPRIVLSQGEPHDAAVNFDTYRILQRRRVVSLPH